MIRDETLIVEKTDLDFSFFKNEKPLILDRDISVLILPSFTQKDAFHNGTIEIFSYLQEKISPEEVELFSTDEDYKELALHSRAHWLGVFLVTSLATPIFTNVISDYISNELQAKNGDEVDFSIIIEKKSEKNIIVSYRGDVEKVNDVLNTVKELSEDGKRNEPERCIESAPVK
ncbi:hypothetical protein [Acinetobacter pittii]|uniref:hypothetical protein n=2 Tax=Acinetobacter pittii TaxID=48296 RepID=UPI000709573C|nr:hypothetical protein [Acinetobacter pittii]KRI34104.1 hypothetical protein APB87_06615 [Acinetobacter pittii]